MYAAELGTISSSSNSIRRLLYLFVAIIFPVILLYEYGVELKFMCFHFLSTGSAGAVHAVGQIVNDLTKMFKVGIRNKEKVNLN